MTTLAPPTIETLTPPSSYGELYAGKLFSHVPDELDEAIAEISNMEAPISLKEQEGLLEKTAKLVQPESEGYMFTVGECVGQLAVEETVEMVVAHHLVVNDATTTHAEIDKTRSKKILDQSIIVHRATNYEKPRSKPRERVNGIKVPSFMGPAINSEDERTPQPNKLALATQTTAQILTKSRSRIRQIEGPFSDVYFAREGLVTPRLTAEMRGHEGTRYNGFSHVVWLGNRTRGEGNPQEEELAKLESTHIQIKIDQHTDAEEIDRLHKKFNPDNIDGKIGFILRVGVANLDKIQDIIEAIQKYSYGSLIISDPMHNNTYTDEETGQKTRCLEDIEMEMNAVIDACNRASSARPERPIRCHGIHLEAGSLVNDTECVDDKMSHPTKVPELDPLLNMTQLTELLSKFVRKSIKNV